MWKTQDQMTNIKASAAIKNAPPEAMKAAFEARESSAKVTATAEAVHVLQGWLPSHTIKDVTSSLSTDTYTYLQTEFARSQRVLIARRTSETNDVFAARAGKEDISDVDHIIMYNGRYWLVDANCLQQYRVDLCSGIRDLGSA